MPGTTTNAADGTVTFDQLPFDAAGTYEYTLVQVAGNADGVTYDSTEYAVTITVTATADNTLTAAVSYAKDGETVDAATFANVYKAPTKPGEPTQPAEPGKPGTKPIKPSKPKVTIFKPQVQVVPSADAVKTLAKTGSTTGAIVIAALFAAKANPSTSRRFQAPLIPHAVGISASMANTDRLCRAISTRPFLPRLHPLCSALRHPVLRGYPSYSVTPLINPLGSIVLPRILVAVPLFRHVPFLRVSFRCILFRLPPPRRHPLIWYTGTLRVQIAVIHNCMCEMVVFGL